MLKRTFDPNQPYTFVIYARMSDKKQNERSPDQQIAEIKRTIKRLKLPWKIKVIYRDDGVKGALIRKRPKFWRMLNDIYSGSIKVDLILVDSTERFARSKEMNSIREKLWEEYGVLLLAAENSFASPLTPEGKIYAAVEAMRATEENRIKAHHVLRAKRDIIAQGRWPGGPAPRGYRLRKIIEQDENGNDKFAGSYLVLDSNELNVSIIKEAYHVCYKTGMRGSKLAKHLKAMLQFRDEFKDLTGDTVNNWLENTIYKGVLTWGIFCTGIVNDVRRLERNDEEDVIVKENFCEAIIEEEVWNHVNLGRERPKNSSGEDGSGKILTPLAPGFRIKYMLAGLARCAGCGGSMNPVANKSKTGVSYVYYRCTRAYDDNCDNHAYIHEPWLREQVIGYIATQLLGDKATGAGEGATDDGSSSDLSADETTEEICSLVEGYLEKQSSTANDSRPAIKAKIAEVDEQIKGWTQTLGNPSLPHEVRRSIEAEFNSAIESRAELDESLAQLDYLFHAQSFRLDSSTVLKKMERLSDILAGSNPSLVNIELSLHIDKILCKADGTVTVRFCKLGLAGMEVVNAIGLVGVNNKPVESDDEDSKACTPRRRARLSASSNLYSAWDLESLAHWATDPHRFEGMDDCWFEEVTFVRPEQKSWSEEHAIAVCEARMTGKTHQQLADEFGVTVPTIRKALKIGQKLDPKFKSAPQKMARARWHEVNAKLVFDTSKSMLMKDMVEHFGKSDVTLRKALVHAREVLGLA